MMSETATFSEVIETNRKEEKELAEAIMFMEARDQMQIIKKNHNTNNKELAITCRRLANYYISLPETK